VKTIAPVAAMIPLIMLFDACTTPSNPVSTLPTPGAPDSEVALQTPTATSTPGPAHNRDTNDATDEKIFADVTDVGVRGSDGEYSFSVTIRSTDTGCTQHPDRWEVPPEEGDLMFRLMLAHSHTEEQLFRSSDNAFEIEPGQPVIIRAHMNTSDYGGVAIRGTLEKGFEEIILESTFAADVENQGPFPDSCAF
jgi:hypothetical protein